jgi:hypothetical protein
VAGIETKTHTGCQTRHLEAYRHQHDFVHVMGPTTKAEQALAALDRHPGHVIAMVDADCRARGTLEELAHIRADVAMFMRPKPFRGRIRHAVRSNTIVLRPSRGAHRFVKIWIEATKEVHDLIQSPLAVAVERATNVTFDGKCRRWRNVPISRPPCWISG